MKTDQELLTALSSASSRPLSKGEIARQRVSFIMGTLKMNSSVTRERVQQIVSNEEGKSNK